LEKNLLFVENGICPKRADALVSLVFGFYDKKSLALKPESAGLVESAAPSASLVIFLNLPSNHLKP